MTVVRDYQSWRRPSRLWPIAGLVLVSVAATWLWAHEGHAPLPTRGVEVDSDKGTITLSPDARDILDVRTADVKARVAEDRVLAYATLVSPWQQHAFVSTRLPGRIANLIVKPGQNVVKGQVLADVQSLELEDLQLEILNLQSAEKLTAKVMEQSKALRAAGTGSGQDILDATNKHQQTVNGMEVAKAKWLSLGFGSEQSDQLLNAKTMGSFGILPIHSPLSGTIIHADVSIGKVVEPAEHLFEVMDLTCVWVKIGVLERDLHKIKIGQPVELRLSAYPDEIVPAAVTIKSLYLDPITHLGTVWAELKNAPDKETRFLPGMHGQAQIVLASPKMSLTVPLTAIVSDGPERFVLVENAVTAQASEFQKRSVVTGVEDGEWVQILGGEIYSGDRVVTTGLAQLAAFFVPGVLKPSAEAAKNMGLVVEPVQKHVVENVMELQGTVDLLSDRKSSASSRLSGIIRKIAIERNQTVHKGDIVAEVASLELQKLQFDLLQVHLELGLTEATLDRFRKSDGTVAQKQIWEAEGARNELTNRRNSLMRKLEAVGLSAEQVKGILANKQLVETLPVRAPRTGVAVLFDKVLGQVIKADEPLFEIHDLSQGYVQGFLSEKEWASVRTGQKVRVRLIADPSFLAEGTITRNTHTFGTENKVLSAWIELDEKPSHLLQNNLMARITVVLDRPDAVLAVPVGAVVREGTKSYVFVLNGSGVFNRLLVELGRTDDQFVQVIAGLNVGDQIAVRGTTALQTSYANIR